MCELPSPIDMKEVGESALDSALPWDRIAGVPFHTDGPTWHVRSRARERRGHARAARSGLPLARRATSPRIDTIREQKTVSLNLNARQEERVARGP